MSRADIQRVTTRTHKLSFDEYTGRFYFESKIEGLERTCTTRAKHIEAMNKGEEVRLEGQLRQVEGKEQIFEAKNSREMDDLRESLKDMRAHRNALEQVARKNEIRLDRNEDLGQYGINASRNELFAMIELQKQKMDPNWRRKKECKILLSQRKQMQVIDRQMPTSTILLSWRRKHSLEGEDGKECGRTVARLVLPPLHVKIRTLKPTPSVSEDVFPATAGEEAETTSLPSIFITHAPKTGVLPTSTNL